MGKSKHKRGPYSSDGIRMGMVTRRGLRNQQRVAEPAPEIEQVDPSRTGFVPRHLRPENASKDWRAEVRSEPTWLKRSPQRE